ncbi:hypothetical protein [Kutzneria sp. CA-103260]|uniref:hypothetical protein n=1 Tax=Kutzneria sp. CA-103260 TaxID=2802641 RepID=UPI001BADCDA2|nr:hypothetical protein [Kutzneria sp. CA-103260]QUQ69494.1 hypothetical protein JJ691_72520 [Kutzneria sp. CA-103260]
MVRDAAYGRRLLISVDAKSYGSSDDQHQSAIQSGLLTVLNRAADRTGFDRSAWDIQSGGDGELSVLPSGESWMEPRLAGDFAHELRNALRDHNHELQDKYRLRLRVAVHYGVAVPADNGFSGQGVVVVSRLVDSRPAKEALNLVPGADLVLILSERVFNDAVRQRHASLWEADFRRVRVQNKEFDEFAYLHLPGHDIHAVRLPEDGSSAAAPDAGGGNQDAGRVSAEPADRRGATVVTEIHGAVDASHAVFGIVNGRQ